MAKIPVNGKDVLFYISDYDLTGGQFFPVVCQLDGNLELSKNEVDASSKCGQYFVQGNDDNSINLEVQWVKPSSVVGEDVILANHLFELYQSGRVFEWRLADDPDTPVDFGFGGEAVVFSIGASAPLEGAATTTCTIRPQGAVNILI